MSVNRYEAHGYKVLHIETGHPDVHVASAEIGVGATMAQRLADGLNAEREIEGLRTQCATLLAALKDARLQLRHGQVDLEHGRDRRAANDFERVRVQHDSAERVIRANEQTIEAIDAALDDVGLAGPRGSR